MMKRFLMLMTLFAFVGAGAVAVAAETKKKEVSQIHWLTSMDEAVKRAKAENKPILLDFFKPT